MGRDVGAKLCVGGGGVDGGGGGGALGAGASDDDTKDWKNVKGLLDLVGIKFKEKV